MMNNFFITRLDHSNSLINQIPLEYAQPSLYIICALLFVFIFASFTCSSQVVQLNDDTLFTKNSTLIVKGLAIIVLLLGHVSQQCTVGCEAIPFRISGNVAVILFLFVSGVGLAKTYQLKIDQPFWRRRIRKLAVPVWLTLALVVPLNFFLVGHTDPVGQLVLNFFGIFWTKYPNSPCWFITYILFLYTVYFLVSLLPEKNILIKLAVLFLLPFVAAAVIVRTGSVDHLVLWPQYSLVFPAGVVCGLYAQELKQFIDTLHSASPLFYIIAMLVLLGLYWAGLGVHRISHLVSSAFYTQLVAALINPVPFLLFLLFFVGLLETKGWSSGLLNFFGRYSFEMYLLHFPFIVYYDFFLFRKPLVLFFFVYVTFVVLLSMVLQRTAIYTEKRFFHTFALFKGG